MWMAGGGVKRGFAYGTTDELGFSIVENPVHVHDLQATILHLLGLNHQQLTYRFIKISSRFNRTLLTTVQAASST